MSRTSPQETVAIVGGGCAGILVASHLLVGTRPVDVIIIEASGTIGRGPAYGTECLLHQLNTRAGDMSAFSHDPDDFVAWAASTGASLGTDDFAPRTRYGEYLSSLLARATAIGNPKSTVRIIHSEVVALAEHHLGGRTAASVGLADGGHIHADRVVLALGMPSSAPEWAESLGDAPSMVNQPWAPGALDGTGPGDRVLLVGTGLTMVDVAIELHERHRCRQMIARSRHGLLPLPHRHGTSPLPTRTDDLLRIPVEGSARHLVRAVRQACSDVEAEGGDWQDVIAHLRVHAQELWKALPVPEQRRLLRHALRYWEIHRHRITPATKCRLDALTADGSLEVESGRVVGAKAVPDGVEVEIATSTHLETIVVDTVVNCTGPGNAVDRKSRLLNFLLANDLARPADNVIGLALEENGDLRLGTGGTLIHTVGWIRRGLLFESTGVPEIRGQAAELAARYSAA